MALANPAQFAAAGARRDEDPARSEACILFSTSAAAAQAEPAPGYLATDGVSLNLDSIVDQTFFAPRRAEQLHKAFVDNTPFPYVVLDGLFSPRLLELMHADFDSLRWSDWRRYDDSKATKRGSAPKTRFGHASQLYFNTIHSARFVDFIEKISGIGGLLPDPALSSGGLHEVPSGGKFALHIDFNRHPVTRLDNRLGFITYLNKSWQPPYGGNLELWSLDSNECAAEIEPVFGRSVLFYQSSKSLHGHPKPVDAPRGRSRRSAVAYYYSNGRADEEETTGYRGTLYPNFPEPRADEWFSNALKYLLPPILIDSVRKAKTLLR